MSENGQTDKGKRKIQVFITGPTTGAGGKTASSSDTMAHLYSGLTKPRRPRTCHWVSKEEAQFICQQLVKIPSMGQERFGTSDCHLAPPAVAGEGRAQLLHLESSGDGTSLRAYDPELL